MISWQGSVALHLVLIFASFSHALQSDTVRGESHNDIPAYVVDYAPLVHLYSGENFWPCDVKEHLLHITPHLNYTPLQALTDHPRLDNLDKLNQWGGGRFVFMQSNDNVEERPEWLGGEKNIPSTDSDQDLLQDENSQHPISLGGKVPIKGGRSDAPAVLIVVDKGEGVVDAFWFFFYSYNLGNVVLNVRFGNHIGDWEHSMIRFRNGEPEAVFFSEHSGGQAYTYDAVEKIGKRPVIYSATGTHAMYATAGTHRYVLPLGLLHDETDRGPLWDPVLNSHTFTYNYTTDFLRAGNLTPSAPTQWFYFAGHWGDKIYPMSDPRQYQFAGQYHYVSGPLGPRFKRLGRRSVCQSRGPCLVRPFLGSEGIRVGEDIGEGEDWPFEDQDRD